MVMTFFSGGSPMKLTFMFFLNSLLLGAGLAMDAFSVSVANGLSEPHMRRSKSVCIAGTYAFFQALMPMIGWILVCLAAEKFSVFHRFIPWIALLLLGFIGGKMLFEGFSHKEDRSVQTAQKLSPAVLLVQGVATSIDALSVGFTISDYKLVPALICAALIAAVTFLLCLSGLRLGKLAGVKLSDKATIFGGFILIFIGIEIFLKGIL